MKGFTRETLDQWNSPAELLPLLGLILVGYLGFNGKLSGLEIISGVGVCLGAHAANYATYIPPKN